MTGVLALSHGFDHTQDRFGDRPGLSAWLTQRVHDAPGARPVQGDRRP